MNSLFAERPPSNGASEVPEFQRLVVPPGGMREFRSAVAKSVSLRN